MRKIGAHLSLDMPDMKINFDRSDLGKALMVLRTNKGSHASAVMPYKSNR